MKVSRLVTLRDWQKTPLPSRRRHHPRYRWLRMAAALALGGFGSVACQGETAVALALLVSGLVTAMYQGVQLWRERPDPYDLSRIWEAGPDPEVFEEGHPEKGFRMCRHCGLAFPEDYAVCPDCGNVVR